MDEAVDMNQWLHTGGATLAEIDDFIDFCSMFDDSGITGRYECYRLWARLLRHRRTPYRRYQIFDFAIEVKAYLRVVSGGNIVDAAPPGNAVSIGPVEFVNFIVWHLDKAF